jgi:hypothetical protein
MAEVRDWTLTAGKVHRQLDGPDRRVFHFRALVDGRPFDLSILLPVDLPVDVDEEGIAFELAARVGKIAEMFRDTPARLSYDALAEGEPPLASADQNTRRILGLPVTSRELFFGRG